MKKHVLIMALAALVSAGAVSCTKPNTESKSGKKKKPEVVLEEKIYKRALDQNDPTTMLYSLNRILTLDSTLTHYLDTLASTYLLVANYAGCMTVCDKILALRPNDTRFLEYSGIASQFSGNTDKALIRYNKLYAMNGDVNYLFQAATVYMREGKLAECDSLIDHMFKMKNADSLTVVLYNDQLQSKRLELKPALHYLKGYSLLSQGRNNDAFNEFKQSAILAPNFTDAREAMQGMLEVAKRSK